MNVFLDMDGVFADFEKYFEEYFGFRHDSVDDNEMWKHINSHDYFFGSLPVMKHAERFYFELYNKLSGVDQIFFLTACPKSNYFQAASQKRHWAKRNIDQAAHVLPVMGGKNKPLFMSNPGDILIDDFQKNITAWENFGGNGIVHTSFANTAYEFNQIIGKEMFDVSRYED